MTTYDPGITEALSGIYPTIAPNRWEVTHITISDGSVTFQFSCRLEDDDQIPASDRTYTAYDLWELLHASGHRQGDIKVVNASDIITLHVILSFQNSRYTFSYTTAVQLGRDDITYGSQSLPTFEAVIDSLQ